MLLSQPLPAQRSFSMKNTMPKSSEANQRGGDLSCARRVLRVKTTTGYSAKMGDQRAV
jgi:hypothetical protein